MALNSKQRKAVELMVVKPEVSYVDIAKEIGIDVSSLWRWRKKPEFQEYMHSLCLERFHDLERLAIMKLRENTMNNNQRAIEYALDYCGYKAKSELDVTSGDICVSITGDDIDD